MTPRFLTITVLAASALLWVAASASAAATWLAPVSLSAAGQDAYAPQVAIDAEGDAVAVWERSDGSAPIIQAASREAGGDWSAPVDLSAAGEECTEPQVAIDAQGDAVAVWRRNDGAQGVIQAAGRMIGGAWSTPVDLSPAAQNAFAPQIALDPEGNAVVVWYRNEGAVRLIQAARREAGGAWSASVTLSAAGQRAERPQVAIDPQGDAIAVWKRSDGSNYIVQATISAALGPWSIPVDLSASGQSASFPGVAIDAAGNAVAVWERPDGGGKIVQASSKAARGGWLAPVNLSASGQEASFPEVAIDPDGEAVVAWQVEVGPSEWAVEAASRLAGAGWSAGEKLSAAGVTAEYPAVGIDAAGDATVLWGGRIGTEEVVQAASRTPTAGWTAPTDISATDGPRGPRLAVGPDGDAVAVWEHGGESQEVIQAAFLDAAGPRQRGLTVAPTIAAPSPPRAAAPTPSGTPSALARAAARVKVKAGKALLRLTCPASGSCKGEVVLSTKVRKATKGHGARKKARARSVRIGAASFTLAAGTHATVAIKLSATGLARLRARGRRGVKASLGGSGVKPGPLVLKATPRRHRAHRHR